MRLTPMGSLLLGLGFVLMFPRAGAAQCRYADERTAHVDAAGATLVRIAAEAGSLEVHGEAGLTAVEVRGQACSNREGDLDQIAVQANRSGDTIRIAAVVPEEPLLLGLGSSPRLNLAVRVPAGAALEITDGSGEVIVRDVAAVTLRDGSGSIELERVAGDVRLADGSGGVRIRSVGGSVIVENDGSGGLDIEDVAGSVRIDRDGSGGIEARRVGGDVVVGRDGSGGIDVDDVRGDFRVDRDGSGGVHHTGVRGTVDIPRR